MGKVGNSKRECTETKSKTDKKQHFFRYYGCIFPSLLVASFNQLCIFATYFIKAIIQRPSSDSHYCV